MNATLNPLLFVGVIGSVLGFRTESTSRPGLIHRVSVEKGGWGVHCSCEHFQRRCADHFPTLASPHLCKHVTGHLQEIVEHLIQEEPAIIAIESPAPGVFDTTVFVLGEPQYLSGSRTNVHSAALARAQRIKAQKEREGCGALILDLTGAAC